MNKPVLIVMAAGMGSRYGGLKQIDPVGNNGQLIIDYSIFDARRAGFETVIFIIKHEIEADFREAIGNRLSKIMNVKYAFQQLDNLPEGYTVPEGRTKPWGTSHAILAAKDLIDGPFAVINADDYYGPEAYKVIYDYLCSHDDKGGKYEFSMVGYLLENTVTENGHVARGVCEENSEQYLTRVTERTHIEKTESGARYTEDDGATWTELGGKTIVSMNLWGFTKGFVGETENRFSAFLDANLPVNPLKCEYFLPSVVSQLVESDKAQVKVLRSGDKWYGVTYKEDKPVVMAAIAEKTASGMYPDNLWEAK
ncbi:MAG: sugar phosphate nucleotidyltransferase [Oscillospiraceae bacterium]